MNFQHVTELKCYISMNVQIATEINEYFNT